MKPIDLFKEWRIILFVVLLITSIIVIHPFNPTNGVLIQTAKSPAVGLAEGYVITGLNGLVVNNLSDYEQALNSISPGDTVRLTYRVESGLYNYVEDNAYPFIAESVANRTSIGLVVGEVPATNINFGLEIEGGIKVLLKPNRTLSSVELENVVEILAQRLNLFGLKEVPINHVQDLSGNQYIRIEFAGATEDDVKLLLEKEGNFEGRVGNKTVFSGKDILSVCISGVQCGLTLEPVYYTAESGQQIAWRFAFQVDLSQEAAQRFANVTQGLVVEDCGADGCYLNETLDLYLDDLLIEDGSLRLPTSIQGEVLTSASITGMRETKDEASNEMRKLQAILQSRTIPVKLEIVRVESLSPVRGKEFAENIFIVFMISILFVVAVISIRYRNLRIALPIITIVIAEIVSTIGVAVMIGWTLDIPSIAGVLASVGTGLDDQIIITDEILNKESKEERLSIKRRIKKAFFIVMASFSCTFASMIPLAFAGAGVLRGFAITTMIGLAVGVFVTRPAYARMLELIIKK